MELTPPNISWKIAQWFSQGPGKWLIVAGIVAAFVLLGVSNRIPLEVTHVLGLLALSCVATAMLVTLTKREPGYWRRYSAYQTWNRYPPFAASSLREIRAIRRMDEGAEFEFTVLEWNGRQYGAVLFQVDGDHCTKEKVVRVFLAQGESVQFGEIYAAPAAH